MEHAGKQCRDKRIVEVGTVLQLDDFTVLHFVQVESRRARLINVKTANRQFNVSFPLSQYRCENDRAAWGTEEKLFLEIIKKEKEGFRYLIEKRYDNIAEFFFYEMN